MDKLSQSPSTNHLAIWEDQDLDKQGLENEDRQFWQTIKWSCEMQGENNAFPYMRDSSNFPRRRLDSKMFSAYTGENFH